MAAAGQESRPFEMAMLGLCLIQTGVVVLRLKTCRKYYKGDAAVNKGRDPIPEKRKGLGSADRPAQMVFGPVAMVSAVAIDVPFLVLEAKYFQVSSDRSRSIRLAERRRHANCVLTWVGIFISNVPSSFSDCWYQSGQRRHRLSRGIRLDVFFNQHFHSDHYVDSVLQSCD